MFEFTITKKVEKVLPHILILAISNALVGLKKKNALILLHFFPKNID